MTNEDRELCGEETSKGTPCQNYADSCPWDHDNGNETGRPSKLDETWDDIMDAAERGLTFEGIARSAGIGVSTLTDWRDSHDEFSAVLNRARARAEQELIQEADAEFVLERSYDYTKTQEIEHSGDVAHEHELNEDDRELALETIRQLQRSE